MENTYQDSLQHAASFILEHDNYAVISHLHPDGDAIGSTLAVGLLLKQLGKTFTMINEGALPERFDYLPAFEQIINLNEQKEAIKQPFSAIIAIDVADEERFGDIEGLFTERHMLLNIDHHPTNTLFGQINLIQPTAASTTEVLYDLIEAHFQRHWTPELAYAIYTGLLTDTGGFRFSNTTEHVFNIASKMVSLGVKPHLVAEHALEVMSKEHLLLLQRVLPKMEWACDNQVALLSVTHEDLDATGATKDDADGMVGYPRKLEGVEVGVLLKELEPNKVKMSLRSKHYINVAAIAQSFGGGGHEKAAGCSFQGSILEAKEKLLQRIAEQIKEQSDA